MKVGLMLLRGFVLPVIAGVIAAACTLLLVYFVDVQSNIGQILLNSCVFMAFYAILCLVFIIRPREVKELISSAYGGNKI